MTVVLYVLKWKVFDFRCNWRACPETRRPTYAEALDDLWHEEVFDESYGISDV